MESLPTTASVLPGKPYTDFASVSLLDLADKMDRDAKIYAIASKALAVIGVIFIVAAVAGATIGALALTGGIVPIAAAVGGATLLMASALFRKCFVEGLVPMEGSDHKLGIRYLEARSREMSQDAERERKIQEISKNLEHQFSSPQVAQVYARFSYWKDVAMTKEEELLVIQNNIDDVNARIREAQAQRKDTSKDRNELSSLLRKKYHLEVESFAPAKVGAAYIHHIFSHPEDDRTITTILSTVPLDYADHIDVYSMEHLTPIFQERSGDQRMVYLTDIRSQTISQLSNQLFAEREISA